MPEPGLSHPYSEPAESETQLELSGEKAVEYLYSVSQEIITRDTFERDGVAQVTITPDEQDLLFENYGVTLTIFYDDWHSLMQKTGYVEFEWENVTNQAFTLTIDELGSAKAKQTAKRAEQIIDEMARARNHPDRVGLCIQLFDQASTNGASIEEWLETSQKIYPSEPR